MQGGFDDLTLLRGGHGRVPEGPQSRVNGLETASHERLRTPVARVLPVARVARVLELPARSSVEVLLFKRPLFRRPLVETPPRRNAPCRNASLSLREPACGGACPDTLRRPDNSNNLNDPDPNRP